MNEFDIDEERRRRIKRRRMERVYRRRRIAAGGVLGLLLIGSVIGVKKFLTPAEDVLVEDQPAYNYQVQTPVEILSAKMPTEGSMTLDELKTYRQLKLREQSKGQGARQSLLPKEVYLTFDDGPSVITEDILDTLKKENVKATFFVIGQNVLNYPELTRRILAEGHDIGIHTHTHDYKQIYSSEDALRKDIDDCMAAIRSVVGDDFDTNLYRFPGGGFNRNSFKPLIEDMGLIYYDWNALNGDAEGRNLSVDRLVSRYTSTSRGLNRQVVLMHDAATKQTTADALPEIISNIKDGDYKFKTLGDV